MPVIAMLPVWPTRTKYSAPRYLSLATGDLMTPARAGKEMSDVVANSRVVLLEGTGHSLMMERPNDVFRCAELTIV